MYGDCNWRLIFTFMLKEISISPNYYPQTYTIINFACIKKNVDSSQKCIWLKQQKQILEWRDSFCKSNMHCEINSGIIKSCYVDSKFNLIRNKGKISLEGVRERAKINHTDKK